LIKIASIARQKHPNLEGWKNVGVGEGALKIYITGLKGRLNLIVREMAIPIIP